MPRGAVRRCRLILRRACRSSASVEVVAPLAVHNGGVWPALRLRAGHALGRSEALRADPRASVAAMYSSARTLRW